MQRCSLRAGSSLPLCSALLGSKDLLGRKDGRKEGRKGGRKEGREEGREEGKRQRFVT